MSAPGRGGRRRAAEALALVVPGSVPAPHPDDRHAGFVSLDALRGALDGVEWAPLRLAAARPGRPASPRLPHALALHVAFAARAAGGTVAVDRVRLAALLGVDAARVDGALDALVGAGVLARASGDEVRVAPAVLGPPPRCAALDWGAVATATAGSPSAWVAAHALAERLERHLWTPVPRADLEVALGAGASGARAALERLAAAGVVERREQRGGVSVYRFADACWADAAASVLGSSTATRPVRPAPSPAPAPPGGAAAVAAHTPAPHATAATGVRLVVGGVEVEVPPGLRARVEIGADGRPTLTLLPGG